MLTQGNLPVQIDNYLVFLFNDKLELTKQILLFVKGIRVPFGQACQLSSLLVPKDQLVQNRESELVELVHLLVDHGVAASTLRTQSFTY